MRYPRNNIFVQKSFVFWDYSRVLLPTQKNLVMCNLFLLWQFGWSGGWNMFLYQSHPMITSPLPKMEVIVDDYSFTERVLERICHHGRYIPDDCMMAELADSGDFLTVSNKCQQSAR